MLAAIATSSSPHSFNIPHSLSPYTRKAKPKTPKTLVICCRKSSLDNESNNDSPSKPDNQLTKLAILTLASGVLTLGSVQDAYAAKSGGRIGGQAFRSSAPRSSGPRINNSRTNIYVNPPVAPPLVGGYGYYGGWGWSPFSFFAPGPGVAVGVGVGGGGVFDLFVFMLFLGTFGAVIRRVFRPRDDDDYY